MSGFRLASPVPYEKPSPIEGAFGVSSPRPHAGLSTCDAWALDHITHCPVCGAWELITESELIARQEPGWVPQPWCVHFTHPRVVA